MTEIQGNKSVIGFNQKPILNPIPQLPETALFKPGVCEISGHIIIDSLTLYESLTEQDIIQTLLTTSLSEAAFSTLAEAVQLGLS